MPLLYVAIPSNSVQWSNSVPDFSALRAHPGQPGKVLVLGDCSSLNVSGPNPWDIRNTVYQTYQNDREKYPSVNSSYHSPIENYAIYCFDVADDYYRQLKATPELLLDTTKFTVVGYFHAEKKNRNLQVVLNAKSNLAARQEFEKKLREKNTKINSFPTSIVKEFSISPAAVAASVTMSNPALASQAKLPAKENDGMLYIAAALNTLEATGYYANPTTLLESPTMPGKVRMLGDTSSLAYPDASLEALRQKTVDRFRQDTNTASISVFLPSPIVFALYISDKAYLQSLKPTSELFLETSKFNIVGFYTVKDANAVTVLNTNFVNASEGRQAKTNFETKLKQNEGHSTKKTPARPELMFFNIEKANNIIESEVIVNNGNTRSLELTDSQQLQLKNNNNEGGFLQAKYILPLLLLLGGLALCAVGGGILISLLVYSFLTTSLIIAGISTMTGGTFLLGVGAAAATYYAFSEEPAEPVIQTAPSSSIKNDCHASPTSAGSVLRSNSGKRRSVAFKNLRDFEAETHSGAGSRSGSAIQRRHVAELLRSDSGSFGGSGMANAGSESETASLLIS